MVAGRGGADFSDGTRRLLGDRAGCRCSFPGCTALTVGPGEGPKESAQVGTAAHIHSAALMGPRGRGTLTDAELADPSNGIWCCANHGREIDTNGGRGYSVETLRAWKHAREEAARRERSGLAAPGSGWVEKVTIRESPRFAPNSVLTLGKGTVIESEASIGKTALYEWIAAAAGHPLAERWREGRLRVEINYTSPLPHRLEYTWDHGNRSYVLDGRIVHLPPHDLYIVHIEEDLFRRHHNVDDLNLLAAALSVDAGTVRSLASEIDRNGSDFLSALHFVEDQPEEDASAQEEGAATTSLYLTQANAGFEQSFTSMSGSEKYRVLVEFGAALARERARGAPTLLFVDGGGWNLSDGSWGRVAKFLLKQPFQSVITPNYILFKEPTWRSWDRVHLNKEDRGSRIPTTVIA
jgi:hypothetical protein